MSAIGEDLAPIVAAGELAGAVTMIWHDRRVLDVSHVGWRDRAGGLPMRRDTLFRIASMSKPITSTVALMLFEQGRFELDDPITRWAPELTDMHVVDLRQGQARLPLGQLATSRGRTC